MSRMATQVPSPSTPHKVGNLFVVEAAAQWSADRGSGTVTVESVNPSFPLAIDELASTDARNLALQYAAASGMGDPRINGNIVGPYPINEDGIPLDQLKQQNGEPYPAAHPKAQPAAYRVDVKVCRKMI